MVKKLESNQSAAGASFGGRSDMSLEGLRHTFREHIYYTQGRFPTGASKSDLYMALAYTVRDQLLHRYRGNPELQGVIERIRSGHFSNGDQELFKPLVDSLLFHDTFMLFADFGAYVDAQKQVDEAYRDQERWTGMSILNVARMGKFSSDRAIREYCRDIWKVNPAPVILD